VRVRDGGLIDDERICASEKTVKSFPFDRLILSDDVIVLDKSLKPAGYPLFAILSNAVLIRHLRVGWRRVTRELLSVFVEFLIEVVAKCEPAVPVMTARELYDH